MEYGRGAVRFYHANLLWRNLSSYFPLYVISKLVKFFGNFICVDEVNTKV